MSEDYKFYWKLQNVDILRGFYNKIVKKIYTPNFIFKIKNFFNYNKNKKLVAEVKAAMFIAPDYSGLDNLNEEQMFEYANKILRKANDSYNEEYKKELKKLINIFYNENK